MMAKVQTCRPIFAYLEGKKGRNREELIFTNKKQPVREATNCKNAFVDHSHICS
jgi:hypothetical protein